MATAQVKRRWIEVAREFVDAKWEVASPNHRKSAAEGLVTLTSALVREGRTPPDPKQLRLALMHWEFDTGARAKATEPPEKYRATVRWIADNSHHISHMGTKERRRQALDALDLTLDGSRAAKSTVARKRAALPGAINYAIEKGYWEGQPDEPDLYDPPHDLGSRRSRRRGQPDQARDLLDAVLRIDPPLHAFFASIY